MTSGLTLQAVFLADYASPAHGVLQVVNGGINTLWRDKFPTNLNIFVAGFIRVSKEHDGSPVQATFIVRSTENDDIYARIETEVRFPPLPEPKAVSAMAPLVIDITDVGIPRTGSFAVVVTLGTEVRDVEFQVSPPTPEMMAQIQGAGEPPSA